jgi:hypothetical protein
VTTDGQSLIVTDAKGRHLDTRQARGAAGDAGTDLPLAGCASGCCAVARSPSGCEGAVAPLRVIEQAAGGSATTHLRGSGVCC